MTQAVANESELYVAPGGPFDRLARRRSSGRDRGESAMRRVVVLIAITWLPICLFSIVQGVAIGSTPRGSFLLDYASYARFFIGLPILILAENVIGPRLTMAGRQFLHDGLVRAEDFPAFEKAVERLARRREAVLVTLALAALAAFGAWWLTVESASGLGSATGWRSLELPGGGYSLAALWNYLVAVPVVLFLMYRWVWRVVSWTLFLRDVARLDLKLVPTHADKVAGLGFLEISHLPFATLAFAMSSVIAAEAAFRIVYEGAHLDAFQMPLVLVLVLTELLFLAPLLVFTPSLIRARRTGVFTYGALSTRYSREFKEKWIDGPPPRDERLLGSSDIQSLADLGNSYQFVQQMRFTAFSRVGVIVLAIATALPGVPLLFLVMPAREIVHALAKMVR